MKPSSAVSLSFLDLLTCCLGAMLLLFFVIVLIRQNSYDAGTGSADEGHGNAGQAGKAFVVVTATAVGPTDASQTSIEWLLMRRDAAVDIPDQVFRSSTPRYGICYVTEPLPRGTQLWAKTRGQTSYQVNLFDGRPGKTTETADFIIVNSQCVYEW